MQGQVDLARYSHLPVGSMTGDWVLSTADAIYARCLRDAGHLLWISDPSLPDVAASDVGSNPAEELMENNQLTMEVCYKADDPLLTHMTHRSFQSAHLKQALVYSAETIHFKG